MNVARSWKSAVKKSTVRFQMRTSGICSKLLFDVSAGPARRFTDDVYVFFRLDQSTRIIRFEARYLSLIHI